VFAKLPQCPDLRLAIGSVRAWLPFRPKPALFTGTRTWPVFSGTRLMAAERRRRFADMLGKQLGKRVECSVLQGRVLAVSPSMANRSAGL
jgi:hypothetical protein